MTIEANGKHFQCINHTSRYCLPLPLPTCLIACVSASGEAEAKVIRARGDRHAADLVESSDTAVRFSLLEKTGTALGTNATFFFGDTANDLGSLLVPAAAKLATGK